jgi:putative ABC transport system permease protein
MFQSIKVAFFIAHKSIIRGNKAIMVFTISMLVLVFLNLIFIPSLLEGLVNNVNGKHVGTTTSDLIVDSTRGIISDVDAVTREIKSFKNAEEIAPRSIVGAELQFNDKRATWGITAIYPETDDKVFTIKPYIVEGEYLSDEDKDKILLGVQVAGNGNKDLELYTESLQEVRVGDKVKVSYSNGIVKEYTVKGIFDTDYIQADTKSFISRSEFDQIYPELQNTASTLHIKTKDLSVQGILQEELRNVQDNLVVRNWKETAGIVKTMTDSFTAIKIVVRTVALIIAGLTIFIITYIELFTKRRQIGIERAIGITEETIITSYTIRAIFYSTFAIIIGSLLYLFVVVPIELRYPFRFPFGYVYLVVNYYELIAYGLILIAVSILSAFIPSYRTTHINILDAIWGN